MCYASVIHSGYSESRMLDFSLSAVVCPVLRPLWIVFRTG